MDFQHRHDISDGVWALFRRNIQCRNHRGQAAGTSEAEEATPWVFIRPAACAGQTLTHAKDATAQKEMGGTLHKHHPSNIYRAINVTNIIL